MNDRECTHFVSVRSYMHCGKLKCFLCYNWHLKWIHGAKFTHEEVNGFMIETQYSFYPPAEKEVKDNPLDKLSDEQLLEIAAKLSLKMNKE